MTENPTDPVQVLAKMLLETTEKHGALHAELKLHVNEIADNVINAILAKTEDGAELRAAIGVDVTKTTRMGKNLRAAMDAYDSYPAPGAATPAETR